MSRAQDDKRKKKGIRRLDFPDEVRARFWAPVDKKEPEECWLWAGSQTAPGTPAFSYRNATYMPRRLAFAWAREWISVRREVLIHTLCSNSMCCNPRHLCIKGGQEHFWSLTEEVGGCRIWLGAMSGDKHKNGVFNFRGKKEHVGKIAFMFSRGKNQLPKKKIFRTCGDSRCVEPSHLFADDLMRHFLLKTTGPPDKTVCWHNKRTKGSSVGPTRRTAYRLFRGQGLRDGFNLIHLCEDPMCCNPWHARPVRKDLVWKALKLAGKIRNGEAAPKTILSDEGVRIARWLYDNTPMRIYDIAEIFGLEHSAMWRIVSEKRRQIKGEA
jgi:hypothetical protein